jgi:NTE family protein
MSVSRRRGRQDSPDFSLVLGGGGARGLAHIGVLKVLEARGFAPRLIVGTSMGAIVGGMYAQHPDAEIVERKMRALLSGSSLQKIGIDLLARRREGERRTARRALYDRVRRGYGMLRSAWSAGLLKDSILMASLCQLLDDQPLESCVIPFAAVSCDLRSGKEFVSTKGPILPAVAASSAIPGVVTPILFDGRMLVDGGPTSLVPVRAALGLSSLPIVAVTVTRALRETQRVRNAIDVVLRAGVIAEMQLAECSLRDARVVLRPQVESYGWADFAPLDEIIAKGEQAAKKALRKIAAL